MKRVGSFSQLIAYSVAVAAVCMMTSAEAAVGKAVVRKISGDASYAEAGGEYKSLRVGKVLGPGASIKTSTASSVDLFLGDNGPVVRLEGDTTLELDTLSIDNTGVETVIETELDLKQGTVIGHVKKLSSASRYEVKTPNGVAAIRGTDYIISANGVMHVFSGTIVAAYTVNGQVVTQVVNAGQSVRPPGPGQNAPVVFPTPSDITFPNDLIRGVVPTTPVVTVPVFEPNVSPIAPTGNSTTGTESPDPALN